VLNLDPKPATSCMRLRQAASRGARGTPHAFANRAKDPLLIMIM
jgi:hypothetical protein